MTFAQVDGGWSAWVEMTDCSHTCGEDDQLIKARMCNNPVPAAGGQFCHGREEMVEDCGLQPCPSNKIFKVENNGIFACLSLSQWRVEPLDALDNLRRDVQHRAPVPLPSLHQPCRGPRRLHVLRQRQGGEKLRGDAVPESVECS